MTETIEESSSIEAPSSIVVIENLTNAQQNLDFSNEDKYRAILFENVHNSTFYVKHKTIKIILVRCTNVAIILNEAILSTVEIFCCEQVQILVQHEVPLFSIEKSKVVSICSGYSLNILNSYSQEVYVVWLGEVSQKVKLPLILFSNHWLWHAPYQSSWQQWSRKEINFLIQENVLHVGAPIQRDVFLNFI